MVRSRERAPSKLIAQMRVIPYRTTCMFGAAPCHARLEGRARSRVPWGSHPEAHGAHRAAVRELQVALQAAVDRVQALAARAAHAAGVARLPLRAPAVALSPAPGWPGLLFLLSGHRTAGAQAARQARSAGGGRARGGCRRAASARHATRGRASDGVDTQRNSAAAGVPSRGAPRVHWRPRTSGSAPAAVHQYCPLYLLGHTASRRGRAGRQRRARRAARAGRAPAARPAGARDRSPRARARSCRRTRRAPTSSSATAWRARGASAPQSPRRRARASA